MKEKITSMKSDPVKKMLMNAAGKPAMTRSIAFLNTCLRRTFLSVSPFARAVMTYCLLISSRNEFFVRNVRVAKPPIVSATMGRTRCQK